MVQSFCWRRCGLQTLETHRVKLPNKRLERTAEKRGRPTAGRYASGYSIQVSFSTRKKKGGGSLCVALSSDLPVAAACRRSGASPRRERRRVCKRRVAFALSFSRGGVRSEARPELHRESRRRGYRELASRCGREPVARGTRCSWLQRVKATGE